MGDIGTGTGTGKSRRAWGFFFFLGDTIHGKIYIYCYILQSADGGIKEKDEELLL